EVARRHAVIAGDVRSRGDAGVDESLGEVSARVARRLLIERQKAALGRDHDFVAAVAPGPELLQRGADGALAALAAVIDRAVDDVAARLHRAHDCGGVLAVRGVVVVAEIGADADGRKPQILRPMEVLERNAPLEAAPIALGARRRCRARNFHRAPFPRPPNSRASRPSVRPGFASTKIASSAMKVCDWASVAPPRAMPGPKK